MIEFLVIFGGVFVFSLSILKFKFLSWLEILCVVCLLFGLFDVFLWLIKIWDFKYVFVVIIIVWVNICVLFFRFIFLMVLFLIINVLINFWSKVRFGVFCNIFNIILGYFNLLIWVCSVWIVGFFEGFNIFIWIWFKFVDFVIWLLSVLIFLIIIFLVGLLIDGLYGKVVIFVRLFVMSKVLSFIFVIVSVVLILVCLVFIIMLL